MNSLRARIALLLIVVIVSVVALATALSLIVLGPPGAKVTIEPVARDVMLVSRLAQRAPDAVTLHPEPAPGPRQQALTHWLRQTLRQMGSESLVVISRETRRTPPIASIPLEGGYLWLPLPHMPPPGVGWHIFWRWILLMTVVAAAIAVFVAFRMTRPLVLLENAIAAVGPEAMLPQLPEKGPAEVRATAQALNRLSARLKTAIESRMRLVAAAGHDLRTPMTRMRLRAEFLDEAERELWLKDLDELDSIADSAILLVREEVDQPAPETIELNRLLTQTVDELKEQGRTVALDAPPALSVKGSALALSRALRNLIINAATHGGGAHVSARADGNQAVVVIEDEGPGVPEAVLGQIFEPFFRVDPSRRKNLAGAGLGLTIAKEIIRRAGGDVTIENKSPTGLRQTIRLPLCA